MVLPQISIDLMGAYDLLGPLGLYVLGIAVYGVFVFHFYRFLARKDIFDLDLQKHNHARRPTLRKTVTVVFYTFKSLFLFPLFVFFWFLVMAGLLLLMGRNQSIDTVMLAAMGVVGAIRLCSYYNGTLSMDVAKILPFALLGIMLIDNSLIKIPQSTDSFREAALRWDLFVYYLGAVVAMEFLLRIGSGILGILKGLSDRSEVRSGATESPVPVREPSFADTSVQRRRSDREPDMSPSPLPELAAQVEVAAPKFTLNGPLAAREEPRTRDPRTDVSALSPEMQEVLEYVDRRTTNGASEERGERSKERGVRSE